MPTPCPDLAITYSDAGGWWRWAAASGEVVPVTQTATTAATAIPPGFASARPSEDGAWTAYVRSAGDEAFEIVGIPHGGGERVLATIPTAAIRRKYPDAIGIDVDWWWLGTSHRLAWRFEPSFDALGGPPSETVRVLDPDTGADFEAFPDTLGAWWIKASPDGTQLAALTTEQLHLVDVATRRPALQVDLPEAVRVGGDWRMMYAPDGRHLVVFAENGLVVVDAANGRSRAVPLAYHEIGMGEYTVMPETWWQEDGRTLEMLLSDQASVNEGPESLSLYEVDTLTGKKSRRFQVQGSILSTSWSPDRRFLATWTQRGNDRTVFVADARTGAQVLYHSGDLDLVDDARWSPDSRHFLYRGGGGDHRDLWLGGVCSPPVRVAPEVGARARLEWLDARRFLVGPPDPGDGGTATVYAVDEAGSPAPVATFPAGDVRIAGCPSP